jgi:hypothetical protein
MRTRSKLLQLQPCSEFFRISLRLRLLFSLGCTSQHARHKIESHSCREGEMQIGIGHSCFCRLSMSLLHASKELICTSLREIYMSSQDCFGCMMRCRVDEASTKVDDVVSKECFTSKPIDLLGNYGVTLVELQRWRLSEVKHVFLQATEASYRTWQRKRFVRP